MIRRYNCIPILSESELWEWIDRRCLHLGMDGKCLFVQLGKASVEKEEWFEPTNGQLWEALYEAATWIIEHKEKAK